MSDWRDKIAGGASFAELSAENMAATRLMKGMGAQYRDIGRMCGRLGIEYDPDASAFQRAVRVFREVYPDAALVDAIDVRSGKKPELLFDEWLEDLRTAIVFFRYDGMSHMTAYVKGRYLSDGALGRVVVRPGARYLREKGGMQLWEQEPVRLVKSFSRISKED